MDVKDLIDPNIIIGDSSNVNLSKQDYESLLPTLDTYSEMVLKYEIGNYDKSETIKKYQQFPEISKIRNQIGLTNIYLTNENYELKLEIERLNHLNHRLYFLKKFLKKMNIFKK